MHIVIGQGVKRHGARIAGSRGSDLKRDSGSAERLFSVQTLDGADSERQGPRLGTCTHCRSRPVLATVPMYCTQDPSLAAHRLVSTQGQLRDLAGTTAIPVTAEDEFLFALAGLPFVEVLARVEVAAMP